MFDLTRCSAYLLARCPLDFFFFFNDPATTEIYTLSLHDALPICFRLPSALDNRPLTFEEFEGHTNQDRKSTRLNSSHTVISYAVFCLKKKKYATLAGKEGLQFVSMWTDDEIHLCVFYCLATSFQR